MKTDQPTPQEEKWALDPRFPHLNLQKYCQHLLVRKGAENICEHCGGVVIPASQPEPVKDEWKVKRNYNCDPRYFSYYAGEKYLGSFSFSVDLTKQEAEAVAKQIVEDHNKK